MAENNKKRGNSLRKIFPNIFFSNKNKDKSLIKCASDFKLNPGGTSTSNQYQSPKLVVDKHGSHQAVKNEEGNDERIYENLTTAPYFQNINNSINTDLISDNSSTSTLVSENVVKSMNYPVTPITMNKIEDGIILKARPQIPPKPQQEILYASPIVEKNLKDLSRIQYPNVYYHSVDRLPETISPLDEIEIYKASQTHPKSVGAEIKKVSTKFLISPKKEAEVRTIQPIRARSLSLDKSNSKEIDRVRKLKNENNIEKPYNYSAPTSPIAHGHKIPNMPTTVSPYESLRKNMIEAEEKRNSLRKSSNRTRSALSPKYLNDNVPKSPSLSNNSTKEDSAKKERTRQRVEAFYWQKIKELKQKEDEYLMRRSMDNSIRGPRINCSHYTISDRSTPTSFIVDPRSCSLPRGKDINQVSQTVHRTSPFTRGAPERRTDSYVCSFKNKAYDDIVQYRYPEKVYGNIIPGNLLPILQRESMTPMLSDALQKQKRLGFENKLYSNKPMQKEIGSVEKCSNDKYSELRERSIDFNKPPIPPLRTSSVLSSVKSRVVAPDKNVTLYGGIRSLCSESESGSEAAEIQTLMHQNSEKVVKRLTPPLMSPCYAQCCEEYDDAQMSPVPTIFQPSGASDETSPPQQYQALIFRLRKCWDMIVIFSFLWAVV